MTFARDLASFADSASQNLTFRNLIINGAMSVWQRGTSLGASGSQFIADRWNFYRDSFAAGITVSRQTTSDTTNLPFIQYCSRVQRDLGNTGTGGLGYSQNIETVNSIALAGKTVTLSFYARKGANYSQSSSTLNASVYSGTGTDQALRSGFTGSTQLASGSVTLTTTWQRFSVTGNVSVSATQLGILFYYVPVGTAGANDYYEITGVQLEAGPTATPFEFKPYSVDLDLCERYFQTWTGSQFQRYSFVYADTSTNAVFIDKIPVCLRSSPSLTVTNMTANGNAITAASINNFISTSNTIYLSLTTSGVSANTVYQLYTASGQNGVVSYSSEL